VEDQIRFVGDLQRLDVRPGDKFVLTCERSVDEDTLLRLRDALRDFLGEDAQVLILDSGLKIGAVRAED